MIEKWVGVCLNMCDKYMCVYYAHIYVLVLTIVRILRGILNHLYKMK